MMHPLHDYIAKQLAERLKTKRIVVWYDPRGEFLPFVAEVRGQGPGVGGQVSGVPEDPDPTADPQFQMPDLRPLEAINLAGTAAFLAEYDGSYFELRSRAEPQVCADVPVPVLLYLPGCAPDKDGSVLKELETAGDCYPSPLKRLARNVLLERYTDGAIDALLARERVTYEDLARAADSADSGPPTILKGIFHDARGDLDLLAAWLASAARDAEIAAKEATRELAGLVRSRLGLDLPEDAPLSKQRAILLRYVLAGEFRSDLTCAPPAALDAVPSPASKDAESAIRELARCLRASHADDYASLADRVESELKLAGAGLPAEGLGAIDTFRFEERALLVHGGELIASSRFTEALALVAERERSFWLDRDLGRKAQWEACRRMAELGELCLAIDAAVRRMAGDADAWIDAYSARSGWYRLDQAQRRLEAWVATLEEEPQERPLALVRRAYEDLCHLMAQRFVAALGKGGWILSAPLHQTRVFSEVVSGRPRPVAYFLVDAMRFEMGVELAERLPQSAEVSVRPAVGALPSITPVGMAALQPGACASFSVVEQGGRLGALIDDAFLPDLLARKRFAESRVPGLADLALDELLSLSPSRLKKRIAGAQVVIVRSQEIDHAGETGFTFQARQTMDRVIDNLARSIRKLAALGVEHAVVSADHGHLFFPLDRDPSMRTEAPGGDTVELHRRCWIGRGGANPPGCVRVHAADLGYASDLDLVFPTGAGVFKSGGDLAFHHGGPSLQELIVPVLTIRMKRDGAATQASKTAEPIEASGLPEAVTNRIFSVTLRLGGANRSLFETDRLVRPLLMSAGRPVGAVGMAIDAALDRATGCVSIPPDRPITVAFLLSDEAAKSLRVVVQDPATDAELYRSPTDIPVRLGI